MKKAGKYKYSEAEVVEIRAARHVWRKVMPQSKHPKKADKERVHRDLKEINKRMKE